ncbi:Crp/Fnr family transcriptional regulator [Desulfotomaculum defluvii]
MNTKLELLGSPWIYTDQQIQWDSVLSKGRVKQVKKKGIIIDEGKLIDCLYYLKNGRVKTVAISPSGHQKIVWYIDSGCIFGETPFFNQKPCDYSFVALTDCEIYVFPKEVVLQEIIAKHPDLTISIIQMLSRKVHILSTQVEDFTFNKPIVRVAKLVYLLHQGHNLTDKKGTPMIPLTQEDIGGVLGMHRVTVNQALKRLKELHALEDHTRHVIVKDLDILKGIFSKID